MGSSLRHPTTGKGSCQNPVETRDILNNVGE